jgi:arginyl-tRNA synthetase
MNKNLLSLLQEITHKALVTAFGAEWSGEPDLLKPDVTQCTQTHLGHYQCNNALKLAKALKKNPREIAAKLIAHFDKTVQGIAIIDKLDIAGAGFINIWLSSTYLAQKTQNILEDERVGVPFPEKRQRIIVEFSSPNIAKELHVGHIRSTIIGDALARLFEFLGHDVLRLNHIGDWGTQFGMLITYMQKHASEVLAEKRETDLAELLQWYRASKKCFDEDPQFKKSAQLRVVALQKHDPETLRAWKMICDISRRAFQEIYTLLDVRLVERGESFYNPYLPEVIKDLESKRLITISEGAKCVFLEGFQNRDGSLLPMIVQKSDGGYNYDTTDLAAMWHRTQVEKADRIIILTDAGQCLHFAMLFKVSELVGYIDPKKVEVDHVPFGVVLGADGKKFKTRSGETEKLSDLLVGAIHEAEAIMQERLPDLPSEEIHRLARILGLDAVKYADLSCHRLKDYIFSYERMLKFEGNTAAFLLYAYVRIQGIKHKVGREIDRKEALVLEHPTELSLALQLCQFGETLGSMARDLLPNRLTDYLYSLAEKFHAFFRDCRVEGSPQEASRLQLCEASSRILEKGLNLLGLKTLDRM